MEKLGPTAQIIYSLKLAAEQSEPHIRNYFYEDLAASLKKLALQNFYRDSLELQDLKEKVQAFSGHKKYKNKDKISVADLRNMTK